jgi:hypothetical protein
MSEHEGGGKKKGGRALAVGAAVVGGSALAYGAYKFFGGDKHKDKSAPAIAPPAHPAKPAHEQALHAAAKKAAPPASSGAASQTVVEEPDAIVQVEELEVPGHWRIHLRNGTVREIVRATRPMLHERWVESAPVIEEDDAAYNVFAPPVYEPAPVFGFENERERREFEIRRERGE